MEEMTAQLQLKKAIFTHRWTPLTVWLFIFLCLVWFIFFHLLKNYLVHWPKRFDDFVVKRCLSSHMISVWLKLIKKTKSLNKILHLHLFQYAVFPCVQRRVDEPYTNARHRRGKYSVHIFCRTLTYMFKCWGAGRVKSGRKKKMAPFVFKHIPGWTGAMFRVTVWAMCKRSFFFFPLSHCLC